MTGSYSTAVLVSIYLPALAVLPLVVMELLLIYLESEA